MISLDGFDAETVLLAYFWGLGNHGRDRSRSAFVENQNALSGLPESVTGLSSKADALTGTELALSFTPTPGDLASGMIKYMPPGGTKDEDMRLIALKPRHTWTEEEKESVFVISMELKLAAHRLANKGYMNVQPLDHEGNPQPVGPDGLTVRFGITWQGLKHAREVIPKTKLAAMRFGWREAVSVGERGQLPSWVRSGD